MIRAMDRDRRRARGSLALAALGALLLPAAAHAQGEGGVWGTVDAPQVPPASSAPAVLAPVPPPAPSGPVARIDVTIMPESLPADGLTAANVLLHARDAEGRIVPADLRLLVTAGEVRNASALGVGTWAAVLVPPQGVAATSITVTAVDLISGTSASRNVPLTGGGGPATVRAAVAESGGGPRAVAASASPAVGPSTAAVTAAAPAPKVSPPRHGRVQLLYPIGHYSYRSAPCDFAVPTDCVAPSPDALDAASTEYTLLSTGSAAVVARSIGFDGEAFPVEYVGIGGGFTVSGYTTETEVTTTDGGTEPFGDDLWNVYVEARGRIPLRAGGGRLDLVPRVGYHAQDVLVFRYSAPTADTTAGPGVRTATFENYWLHGLRFGLELRYLVRSGFVEPHAGYDATASFTVGGLTNHHVRVGVAFHPEEWLLIDAGYDFLSRDIALELGGDGGALQRGEISERTHAFVVGAGLAF